jgi:hypothetical protein
MQLAVDTEDETRHVEIDLAEALTFRQTQRVFDLCGSVDPMRDLAQGRWRAEAARAIVFVKLEAQLPELALEWEEFTVDFGLPDPELEQLLPVEDV